MESDLLIRLVTSEGLLDFLEGADEDHLRNEHSGKQEQANGRPLMFACPWEKIVGDHVTQPDSHDSDGDGIGKAHRISTSKVSPAFSSTA